MSTTRKLENRGNISYLIVFLQKRLRKSNWFRLGLGGKFLEVKYLEDGEHGSYLLMIWEESRYVEWKLNTAQDPRFIPF
jgi:hypothetical protein